MMLSSSFSKAFLGGLAVWAFLCPSAANEPFALRQFTIVNRR
jgi:hypothetical protein